MAFSIKKDYIFSILLGGGVGLLFPLAFVALDLYQLGESFNLENALFVVESQNIYWFSTFAFPLVFAAIFSLFIKVWRDRQEICEANRQIKEEKQKVAMNAKLASLGELSAGIGHEINNPLAILQGTLEIMDLNLRQGKLTNEELKKRFSSMKETIQRIGHIVEGLRTLAKMDQEDDNTLIDLHSDIEKAIGFVREIYLKDGVEIAHTLNASSGHIYGKSGKLQQVMLNLMANAKDAILEVKEGGEIKISTEDSEGWVVLKISDDGKGIDKENLDRVFDAFFTTKDVGKGTGMGLSIVHSLIEEMGGQIDVDSSPEGGTTFYLSFPAVNAEELEAEQEDENEELKETEVRKVTQEKKSKAKVLIADDEEGIREFLNAICAEIGIEAEMAIDGQDAYDKFYSDDFDILITDLKMPKMSGIELMKSIMEKGHPRETKFIVITGGIGDEYSQEENEFLQQSVDSYLKKPFDFELVCESLLELLEGKGEEG